MQPLLYRYGYDQLNRLVSKNTYNGLDTSNRWTPLVLNDYKETFSYDANGNILTALRNATTAGGNTLAMDALTYHYQANTNKLTYVTDTVGAATHSNDIDNQSAGNYSYDKIGNLISDNAESLQSINWTVYGKIKSITKPSSAMYYGYDAAGNRVHKKITGTNATEEIYVRDAQGNPLAVYRLQGDSSFWKEQHLYGSSRLGIYQYQGIIPAAPVVTNGTVTTLYDSLLMGNISYELSNHLGNVLAVINDKKIGVSSLTDSSLTDHYVADVLSLQDYYAFGSQMLGRSYQGNKYRYGFNGQEKSDEVKGEKNHNTALFWEYDMRLGRRWNLDPKPSAGISQYSTFANNPIWFSDPLGDTVVAGAGGRHNIDIDEKQNDLDFYQSNVNYTISGSQIKVPVQSGQLRSFSNIIGKFTARWTKDQDGNAVFAGYKNDKNQTLEGAINELKEFTSSWKYKLWSVGNYLKGEHDRDPLSYNLKLASSLLMMSATAAVEPVGYLPGYNPSVTTKSSMSALGTLKFAARNEIRSLSLYWPANGGAMGDWYLVSALPGAKLDRFGGLGGNYLAPYGTPFNMRALPVNGVYRAFEVLKPFSMEASFTSPAFGKMGTGIQYRTPISVEDLLNLKYIRQIK